MVDVDTPFKESDHWKKLQTESVPVTCPECGCNLKFNPPTQTTYCPDCSTVYK